MLHDLTQLDKDPWELLQRAGRNPGLKLLYQISLGIGHVNRVPNMATDWSYKKIDWWHVSASTRAYQTTLNMCNHMKRALYKCQLIIIVKIIITLSPYPYFMQCRIHPDYHHSLWFYLCAIALRCNNWEYEYKTRYTTNL